jgi:hypothetical protein
MDLLYAIRDLGVADPAADRSGEQTVGAALAQEIDKATVARRRGGARRRRPRVLAGATAAVAASATAVTLLLSAAASPPPAFAVTRHHDGSVSVKVNRTTSLADVNRKLAAMGIEKIDKQTVAVGNALASIPLCSSIPPGWKGAWVQVPTANEMPGTTVYHSLPPGSWFHVFCAADNPANDGSGNAGNTGSGNTGAG